MEPLLPGYYYHIYNHSIGNEVLYKEERNYQFFLEKYKKFIIPVADTYAYCLMVNHFHLLVKVKDDYQIQFNQKETQAELNKLKTYDGRDEFISKYVSKQFAIFFSSYTQAFNKEYSRKGSLFLKNFKRKSIEDDRYFIKLINYIHFNPVTHGFTVTPKQWKYSSYNSILSPKPTLVRRDKVLEWFDGTENFIEIHRSPLEL